MNVYIAWAIREVVLLALIGFLCWLFKSWVPVLLILCSNSVKEGDKS